MSVATLLLLLPEIVLIAAAVAIYMSGARRMGLVPISQERGLSTSSWIAVVAFLLAATALASQGTFAGGAALAEPLRFDPFARLVRWLALGFGVLLLFSSRPRSEGISEHAGSLLLTIAGLMLASLAGDLVLMFVSLELISIPTYILLYLGRRDAASQEAAAKYFFLSVLASAILLYGFSFLYGVAGSTDLTAIRAAVGNPESLPPGFSAFSKLAMAMIFGGLCFKIAAVPFHFYAPDVYQGTTHPNAALLSVVPKAAGLVVMVRILVAAMPGLTPHSWQIVLAVAALTMTFGNVVALWQDNLRRLLAYSSIAQSGYMLIALAMALAVGGGATAWDGIAALAFYLTTYAVATIGVFAILEHLGKPGKSLDGVDELAGLGSTRPVAAAMLAICLFSLMGIPPIAGFWGKFLVFGGALSVDGPTAAAVGGLRWWFAGVAILGVLNAAVAAAYYLRIVAVMYFRTPLASPRTEGGAGAWTTGVACTLLLLAVGFYPGMLICQTEQAGKSVMAKSLEGRDAGRKKTATPVCPVAWSGGQSREGS